MALPYPTKVVLPFDIATAQDMNERHANDVALANGSGLDNGAVTPDKRSGGFAMGSIPSATLGTTGNKAITGLGFTPKHVDFDLLPTDSSSGTAFFASGAMNDSGLQFYTAIAVSPTSQSRISNTNAAFAYPSSSSSTTHSLTMEYVSMDADGFTVNVVKASSTFAVRYRAYA